MERPCYQCGLVCEDFLVFCPQCRAPQIRVVATVPAVPIATAGPLPKFVLPSQSKIDWWNALPSAVLAVLISALLTVAFFGNGAIGFLFCGALSVFFYSQRNRFVRITRWVGAQLGAFSGLLGLGIIALFHDKLGLRQMAMQAMQMTIDRNTDLAQKQILQDFATQRPEVLVAMLVVMIGVVFLLISSLGGAIGASLMKRWRPPVHFVSPDENKLEPPEKTERSEHDR